MMRLICIPFSGGAFNSYKPLRSALGDDFNVVVLDLPGRGMRMAEKCLVSAPEMAEDVVHQIEMIRDSVPFAIFGHSLGALVGYLVVHRLREMDRPLPLHLFVSGKEFPGVKRNAAPRHLLPSPEFRAELRRMGGSPPEVLENDELMEFFEPVLRADFQAVDTFIFERTEPFEVPVTAMIGRADTVSVEDAERWRKATSDNFQLEEFRGGHFFINEQAEEVASMIRKRLETTRSAVGGVHR